MFIENHNLLKLDAIIVSGVTTHSIKTKYAVVVEVFEKKHTFHVLDDHSPVQHQGILGIDFLTANNFIFSNERLILSGKEFKRCDKPHPDNVKRKQDVLVIFKDGTGAITRMNDSNKPILPSHLHSEIKGIESFYETSIYPISEKILDNTRLELLKENTRLSHIQEHSSEIWDIITEFHDIFTLPGDPLPLTKLIEHEIKTSDEIPVNTKQYRYPPIHQEEIKKQIKDMLAKGIIQESDSPYNSPLWIVPKKQDASGKPKWRLVIDFRKLNEKTIQDAYPLPNIDEILDQLGNARYFSAFDLASGFHQIGMHPKDIQKTAFSTPNGHYEYTRMPFGLKNAPPTFQRMMNRGLKGLIGNNCLVYIDDIIVYGKTIEEHNKNLRILFERLRQVGLKLQPDKCEYLKPELEYLGHVISEQGIQPNPNRIEKVKTYPVPRNPKEIKQFLGLVGYYRKFIKDFSKIAKPLTRLLQKSSTFQWTNEQQHSFESLKSKLITQPVLSYPDWNRPFVLTTDASNEAIGAILSQGTIGKDKPLAFAFRTLNKAETRYSTTEKELLAIVWATKHFRQYLYGKKFTIVTDHKPLVWLMNVKDPNSRLMRWRLKLEEFDYKIVYKPGKTNTNADGLSRIPVNAIDSYLSDEDIEHILSDIIKEKREIKIAFNKDPVPGWLNIDPKSVSLENLLTLISPIIEDTNADPDKWTLYFIGPINTKTRNTIDALINTYNLQSKTKTIIEERPSQWFEDKFPLPTPTNEYLPENDYEIQKGPSSSPSIPSSSKPKVNKQIIVRNQVGRQTNKTILFIETPPEITRENEVYVSPHATHRQLSIQLHDFLTENDHHLNIIHDQKEVSKLISVIDEYYLGDKLYIYVSQYLPEIKNKNEIISDAHSGILGGHYSIEKTLQKIRQKYNWPNITVDVKEFIDKCELCQLNKPGTQKPYIYSSPDIPQTPNDKISIDIMGPFEITNRGNRYILVTQDYLTRYILVEPLVDKSTAAIIRALWYSWLRYFGKPKELLSDNALEFTSNEFKTLCDKLHVKHVLTSVYHPQSNGKNERSHLILTEYIRHYINEQEQWDMILPQAMLTYNCTVNKNTGYTPYELQFGREPNHIFSEEDERVTLQKQIEDSRFQHENKLEEARRSIRDYQNSNIPIKNYVPIESNELILVKNFNAKSFEPQWKGPFPVVRHDKFITYHIRENGEIKQYHRSDIKPFVSGNGNGSDTNHSDTSSPDSPGSSY
ncbi:uncharacterized protein LOC118647910 [Monomorium pharaonis]|uniref:uncharacterized protein LOC118647910 n=1 Tax=Monomorium pharaonis TaxID=307658 RepID=UPI001746C8C7|nr:uncharacterized protein LOC118647910 [Monomorium pharaonis]